MEVCPATCLYQEEADVHVRPMEVCSLLFANVTAHSTALYDGCYPLCQHRTGQSWFPLGAAHYLPPFFLCSLLGLALISSSPSKHLTVRSLHHLRLFFLYIAFFFYTQHNNVQKGKFQLKPKQKKKKLKNLTIVFH